MHASYYYRAHACIMVFDVTRKVTYKNLEKWYDELQVRGEWAQEGGAGRGRQRGAWDRVREKWYDELQVGKPRSGKGALAAGGKWGLERGAGRERQGGAG